MNKKHTNKLPRTAGNNYSQKFFESLPDSKQPDIRYNKNKKTRTKNETSSIWFNQDTLKD